MAKLEDKVLSLEEGSCMDAIILPLHGSLPPEMQVHISVAILRQISIVHHCVSSAKVIALQ